MRHHLMQKMGAISNLHVGKVLREKEERLTQHFPHREMGRQLHHGSSAAQLQQTVAKPPPLVFRQLFHVFAKVRRAKKPQHAIQQQRGVDAWHSTDQLSQRDVRTHLCHFQPA